MYLSKELLSNDLKREALRYQPSFDLRKNIAKVIACYSIAAVQKGITLDIFVSPETPNYFQGNVSSFLMMLSQLLNHCIATLHQGNICIRISHDSLHQSNSCETELSILITSHNPTKPNIVARVKQFPQISDCADRAIRFNGDISLHRINHLCNYFAGSFSMQKLDEQKIQYLVTFILQQTHPASMVHPV
jgi:hypothetical protein